MRPTELADSRQFVAAVLLLTSTLGVSELSARRKPQPLVEPLRSIPMEISDWKSVNSPLRQTVIDSLAATEYLSRIYRSKQSTLDLFVAYYADQRSGESMHSPRHCLPGNGWDILEHATIRMPVGREFVAVNKYLVQKDHDRLAVLYWYQSRKRVVASEYAGKFWLLWDSITTGYTGGSMVRIAVPPQNLNEGLDFASYIALQLRERLGT